MKSATIWNPEMKIEIDISRKMFYILPVSYKPITQEITTPQTSKML